MKVITVYQPWASMLWLAGHPVPEVASLGKHNETRGWSRKYRGPLAIHASKDRRFLDLARQEPFRFALSAAGISGPEDLPLGAVIAVCNLVDCVPIVSRLLVAGKAVLARLQDGRQVEGNELTFGDYTPGRFAWILADIKPLPKPIPAVGHQGLWNWEPPEVPHG